MSTETSCPRLGKWIGGCRFEARYDKGEAKAQGLEYQGMGLQQVLDKLRSATYVGDVCIRCGKRIERIDTV